MDLKPRPRYLTSIEVAAACGVSPRTVSSWIRDGAIPDRTVGVRGRVAVEDLRRFLLARGMPIPPDLTVFEPAPAPSKLAAKPVLVEPARRRRVLVIDDDEALLSVVTEILVAAGYDVETARHGFLAGYLAGHHQPDVILLDILMHGLDGYEVLSLVRRHPEARSIPVVACTSLQGAEAEARIRTAGFDAYVKKPFDFRALLETIADLVR